MGILKAPPRTVLFALTIVTDVDTFTMSNASAASILAQEEMDLLQQLRGRRYFPKCSTDNFAITVTETPTTTVVSQLPPSSSLSTL
ncbi:uncharacterized protein LAESUDRAFT_287787 [Laetiporus sulphureus 93-53]|uniref:Uncharacterized protein n=1 Tax=Laetiporus sulphureus 93-53 TaxID=1314785 RepID=A0A165DCZ0_9APHY|nr:uncharacterized protein LAESUDRAFT_287787 [Laetiporus sulphureus 93-53]KZT04596.1 hypothetical protein LAESUDRAFT_287787 [Laetiporus sulphureus 93-53]